MCNFIYFKIIEFSVNVNVCISQMTNGFLFNESFENLSDVHILKYIVGIK